MLETKISRFNGTESQTQVTRSGADILSISAQKKYSFGELYLDISKISLHVDSIHLSSKTFPLVVNMREKNENETLYDIYSFDSNGVCLVHGYSVYRDGKPVVDEEHDTDISRLVEHGATIEELLKGLILPSALAVDTTVYNLSNNSLEQK